MKIHYAPLDRANESDNNDYWGSTACGLEITESPLTNKWGEVNCKKCLNKKKLYEKEMKEAMDHSCNDMQLFNEFTRSESVAK